MLTMAPVRPMRPVMYLVIPCFAGVVNVRRMFENLGKHSDATA